MLKVLENDGTIISGSDGGVINRNLTNFNDGIIHGRYNDFAITYTSNLITVKPGHLIKSGLNVVMDEMETISVTSSSNIIREYLFIRITANSYGISAELTLSTQYPSTSTLEYTNDAVNGVTAYVLGSFIVGPSGITEFESYKEYLKTYPSLYEYVIHIDDYNYEGGVVSILLTITTKMDDLDGMTLDDFIDASSYLGYGYVQASSGSSSYYEGPGLFKFNWGVQGESSVEDYRGREINFTMQGNEAYEVISKRQIM